MQSRGALDAHIWNPPKMPATVRDENVDQQKTSKSYEKFALLRYIFKSRMVRHDNEFPFNEILDSDGDINYQTPDTGDTVLHFAGKASRGDENKQFVKQLIDRGADPTIANRKGQTPVHLAAIDFKNCITRFFECPFVRDILSIVHIRNGNTTNFKDTYGFSHFHAACTINNLEIVEFFLKNEADVNEAVNMDSPEYPGYTSLHFAAEFGSDELVDRLLDHGADLTKDSNGMSPLHIPIRRNMEIFQHMSLYRIPVYHDPLFGMSMNEEMVLAEMATNEKMITSIVSKTNETAMAGVDLFPFYVMRTLEDDLLQWTPRDINKCIPMDSNCWPGYSALHFAARFDINTVKLLLDKGANIEAKDADGVTPFDLCVGRYSVEDIHHIISSHNVWRNVLLSDGKTTLLELVLAMKNPSDFTKFLAERDVNGIFIPRDSPLWPGFSVLHLAVTLSKKRMRSRVGANRAKLLDDGDDKRKSNELIKVCLDLGADVAVQDRDGSTPIHLAFRRMNLDAMYQLIDCCAGKSNPTDKDNLSLLHIACAVENENLVEELLASGADVNGAVKSSFQWDPEVKYFHELDSDEHLHVWPGSTPLHVALMTDFQNGREVVKLLMKSRADLDAKDAFGLTPLHRLIKLHCQSEIVDDDFLSQFITRDCVVDGLSYLHIAALHNYPKTMKKLLDLGADVNSTIIARERLNPTFVHSIALHTRKAKLSDFLNYFDGNAPLHMACYSPHTKGDIPQTLMSSGADVLAKNSEGVTPIREILEYKGLVRHLLSLMNEDDEKRLFDEMGLTKLHLACQLRDEKMIRDCLNNGANVNARVRGDSGIWSGFTPLHVIVVGDYYSLRDVDDVNSPSHLDDKTTRKNRRLRRKRMLCRVTRLLLESGADVMIADAKGETPLMLNIRENHIDGSPAHIDILWKELKNSNVNPVSNQGISHFHLACIRYDVDLAERFLKLGVDPNQTVDYLSKDYPGYTPLHFAVCRESGYVINDSSLLRTIDLLLRYGANVDARNMNYDTPLHLAAELPLISGLPYKRLFWAGADPEAKNLYGRVPDNRMFFIDREELLRIIFNYAIHGSREYLRRTFSPCIRCFYRVCDWVHANRNIVTKKEKKKKLISHVAVDC